jgi:hypothetical protein
MRFQRTTQDMTQPDELKKNVTDVWTLFCACIARNLETVKRLLAKDP